MNDHSLSRSKVERFNFNRVNAVGRTLILRVIRERDPGTQIASVPDAPRLWRLFKGLGHGLIQKRVLYKGGLH